MQVVLLSRDLLVISRTAGAVEKVNATMVTSSSAGEAIDAVSAQGTSLLILDLSTENLNVAELVGSMQHLPASPDTKDIIKIIAFGPHVHKVRLTAAKDAGCDQVISRGEFDRDIDHLLAEML